jgi:hypothetical protein
MIKQVMRNQYGNILDIQFAALAYRDEVEDGIPSEICRFTRDAGCIASFFGRIEAKGGGDTAEDWAAALNQMLKLDWRDNSTKLIIWMADAPSHGDRYTGGLVDDNHSYLEYQLEPLVIRLAKGRVVFQGVDMGAAATTFREIQKIYIRNGGISLTYEKFVSGNTDVVARIGQFLQQQTMIAVEQTVMQMPTPMSVSPGRSTSAMNLKPPQQSLGTDGPQMTGILSSLTSSYSSFNKLSDHGGTATIYFATRNSDYQRVAIKHMQLPNEKERRHFNREVDALKQFSSHPYCLTFIASSIVGNEGIIITSFIPNGDLETGLKRELHGDQDGRWPTIKSKNAFRLASTLKHVHSRKFLHGDIKPFNIFLDINNEAILGDWGLAKDLSSRLASVGEELLTTVCGTVYFMAPELQSNDEIYDQSVDVFAWGVLIYAMFAKGVPLFKLFDDGKIPETSLTVGRKIMQGRRYRYLNDIPPAWWTLICRCWDQSPACRPSMAEIVDLLKASPSSYLFPGTDEQQLREYARTIS